MTALNNPFNTLQPLPDTQGHFHSLPALESAGFPNISRLPISIRILLESVLRNCDNQKITKDDVANIANWSASTPSSKEVPFTVARIVLQDFTGVPLLVDLAAMRDAVAAVNQDPSIIEPLVPVDLVIDHSVQVDKFGSPNAFQQNLEIEFQRNRERYEFLKWGQDAFKTFNVVPPGIGIVHQVNLEHLASVVFTKETSEGPLFYPDTLVGTDSHTTMINGLGIVGWGVGGIEAEAGMLGQPIYIQTPQVIGVHLKGSLKEGVTATDLTLRLTQLLRQHNVVGKFVEYFGEGASNLSVADRATIGNMAPEYGATIGFFGIDEKTIDYLKLTGRSEGQCKLVESYYKAQNMWGIPQQGQVDYTETLELDLSSIVPAVSGPKRPQDRIDVPELKAKFQELYQAPVSDGGFGKKSETFNTAARISDQKYTGQQLNHGSVVMAAITSCTNTSNPSVMIAAGLLAKKAVERGMTIKPTVKTSLAPGSRVVTEYLNETSLQQYLDTIGFNLVGYGCTTCIGNSGPLDDPIESTIKDNDIITASVLSGNRNFEARVHPSIKANFLMSPPLVVAYALAGTVNIDLQTDSIGKDKDNNDVFLKDLWPSHQEIQEAMTSGIKTDMFTKEYSSIDSMNPEWNNIPTTSSNTYNWNESSTYIQNPPFFQSFSQSTSELLPIKGMRSLAILGDSVTTDHISPAGRFTQEGPAGQYLTQKGVEPKDFNSFGSRRGNDRIMTRGTFANVRINNKMADGKEGGFTKHVPSGEVLPIFDACQRYNEEGTPLIVFAGSDYGMGSSRDWAAKGTALLGVKAVVAKSFERIHRSNLLGMGVLPLQFQGSDDATSLGLTGDETFSLPTLSADIQPGSSIPLTIQRSDGTEATIQLTVRIDTDIEKQYYLNGGILPYVLRNILASNA